MKYLKIGIAIVCICLVVIAIGACAKKAKSKEPVKKQTVKEITAKEIIDKVVDNYNKKEIENIKISGRGSLSVYSDKKFDIGLVMNNYFVEKNPKECITNLKLSMTVDKKTNKVDLYLNQFGNVIYGLNTKNYYNANEIYSMLGIKYNENKDKDATVEESSAPQSTPTVTVKPEESVKPTESMGQTYVPPVSKEEIFGDLFEATDIPSQEATPEPTERPLYGTTVEPTQGATKTPEDMLRKAYTVSDLQNLVDKLSVEDPKAIEGESCYTLSGKIKSVQLYNFFITNIESSLYAIPKEFGDITYNIYVNKSNYEIVRIDLDMTNLVETLSGQKDISNNILELLVETNTDEKIVVPEGREYTMESYSEILYAIQDITNGIKNMNDE